MTRNDMKDAVGILRGIRDRVQRLEESVSSTEGIPNILRRLVETTADDDQMSTTTHSTGSFTWGDDWGFSEWSEDD